MRRFSHKGYCEGKEENCSYEQCEAFGNLYLIDNQSDDRARLKHCTDKPFVIKENIITRSQPNKASKKRIKEGPRREEVRRIVLERDMGLCRAKFLVDFLTCSGPLDVDEVIPRGRGGDHLNPDNCQVLCRAHHRWKHDHPKEAEELGLTKSLPPKGG